MAETKSVEELLHYPLSDNEIRNYLGGMTKVHKYNEIMQYPDIESLLAPFDNVVILLETGVNFGHWICVKRVRERISFFDSYGEFPDKQKHHVNEPFLINSGQGFNKICQLLDAASYKYLIEFSDRPLQDIKNTFISTCGQWCCNFIKSGMNVDEFYNYIDSYHTNDLDRLCCELFKEKEPTIKKPKYY